MLDKTQKDKWHLITLDNPEMINGNGIYCLINLLLTVKKLNFVILNDLEGAPNIDHPGLITFLQYKEGEPILVENLLEDLKGVLQFDWADFFLFENLPLNWICYELYPDNIEQTDTTIRAVDGQYIYIYTKDEKIVKLINDQFSIESLKFASLDNLDHPY